MDKVKKTSHQFHFIRAKIILAILVIPALALLAMSASISLAQTPPDGAPAASESSDQIAADIASQQVQLEKARDDLAVLNLNIATAEQYLDQNRMQLADANERLSDAEDRYNNTLNMFEGRLAEIYKLGSAEDITVIFSSDSFSDAASRISYLTTISENDQKLVDRVKADAERVQSIHTQIDRLKQAQAVDVAGMEAQRAQLQSQIDSGVRSIDVKNAELAMAQAQEEQQQASALAAAGAQSEPAPDGSSINVGNEPPSGLQPTGVVIGGVASWYGPGFNGHRTANGETYNMYAYTAANKTLPFNTWLKVTFNGRSVFVRINDRGPYVGDRFLDLSYASAQALGLTGIGYVRAEVYR